MIKKCKDLTIGVFYDVLEDISNVVLLNPDNEKIDPDKLINIWHDILDEYYSLIGDNEVKETLRIKAELVYIENKLSNYKILYDLCGDDLEQKVKDLAVNICKSYKITFDKQTLNAGINALNSKISRKNKELEDKKTDDDTDSSNVFEETKNALENYKGFYLNRDVIKVSEWASYIVAIRKKNRDLEKINNG